MFWLIQEKVKQNEKKSKIDYNLTEKNERDYRKTIKIPELLTG